MSDAQLRPPVGADDHVQGAAAAPVTLVEYGDFECPHCAVAHPVVQELQRRLGDQLRFVYRHFPLTEIHPHALHAAEAAESVAAQQGEPGFWTMHDTIFEHQQDSRTALSDRHLARYALEAGADAAAVERDLERDAYADRVQHDFMSGVRSGVNGTPTFFINGARFEGNWTDPDLFEAAVVGAGAHR